MLFGRPLVFITKRSWSWDAKSVVGYRLHDHSCLCAGQLTAFAVQSAPVDPFTIATPCCVWGEACFCVSRVPPCQHLDTRLGLGLERILKSWS